MFNLQGSEIIFILLLALVILGPEKLPGAIRRFTRTYAELRKMGTGFQDELKSALDEPMREVRETADLLRETADPAKVAAKAETEVEIERRAERVLDDTVDETVDETADDAATPEVTAPSEPPPTTPTTMTTTNGALPPPLPDAPSPDLAPPDRFADPVDEIPPPSPNGSLPAPDPDGSDTRSA